MTETIPWLENLKRRRVPQFAGMYIAATWLVIELGDWVTERFDLPAYLTSYVFVAMLVMLPAVILFAYGHGAPGKDRWTRTEKFVIPLNAAIAALALWFVSPVINVEAATETVQIEDETGVVQEFEVARYGYHKEIVGFFWDNQTGDPELDWLRYGLPVMLTYDIRRVSPIISAITPLDDASLRERLRDQGFERLTDVPRGLAIEVSRDRRSAALVTGEFRVEGDAKIISASVFETASGALLGSRTASADNWMSAVDEVTAAILEYTEVTPADNQSDDPVRQHFSDSLDAIRHFTFGLVAIGLDNDYPQGIAEFETALELDAAFAEAGTSLAIAHYLSGDIESARTTASNALRNSYRLSDGSRFVVKANRYIFDGDYERGERVLDIWAQVQPNSTRAWQNIAQLSRLRGGEGLEKALGAYDRLLELNPKDYTIYLQKADLEQQRGNYTAAAGHLQRYLEFVPDSGQGYLQLAGIYLAQGDLDAAQQALEDAAILSDNPVASELELARIEVRRGLHDDAKARLQVLIDDDLNDQQRTQVLTVMAEVDMVLGEVEAAIRLIRQANEFAKSYMPPAMRIFTFESQEAGLLALLGRPDEAIAFADAIGAQLQPPLSNYLNFVYTTIYAIADNREEYRRRARDNRAIGSQLPDIFQPFLEIEAAQVSVSVWDGDYAVAIEALDRASTLLDQSFLQVAQDNLTLSDIYIGTAELYLQAGETQKAKAHLENILRVFPSNGYAKLALARALVAEGDMDNARLFLGDVLKLWAGADEGYVRLKHAEDLLASLD
jgi:tetratricopeptide (TPR) repeat protein